MRSNDIYFGLPYDYIYFVSLGTYVAKQLDIPFGLYTHHATSMHMYLRDVDKFVPHEQRTTIDIDKIIEKNYEVKNEK